MSFNIYGKNPISLENYKIDEWLAASDDNILLILDKTSNMSFTNSKSDSKKSIKKLKIPDMIYCLKRSFLQTPSIKNIYLKCITQNNVLLNKETYSAKTAYFHLGYFLNKSLLIDLKILSSNILNKNNIFKIDFSSRDYEDYINKESLELSQFGLAKKPSFKIPKDTPNDEKEAIKILLKQTSQSNLKIDKFNIPHKKDVYFETILSKALLDYSYQWDAPVNLYLRQGDSYFQTSIFKQYHRRYGPTIQDAEINIKKKTNHLDRAFMEAAPKNQNPNTVYFRGMKMPFQKLANIGDTEIIPNFISISTSFKIAVKFSGLILGQKCCLYKLTLDVGIPMIDMVNTTMYKNEKEVLLPRNLVFKLVKIEYIKWYLHNIPIAVINVSLQYQDQFKITSGCKKFILGKLIPYNPAYINSKDVLKKKNLNYPVATDEKGQTIKVEDMIEKDILKDDVQNHSVPLVGKKCPKGYRINKTTGMCDFYDPSIKKTKKVKKEKVEKPKKIKKRCPNGTRKNKITGNCEPKIEKK